MSGEIILIDAYSQIFRGFYAVRNLTSHDGTPTNAVFVFARLLLKLHHEYPENPGAMVFDCGRVRFREELEPLYKKNRPPMPEELKVQVPLIREMAGYFGWPLWEEPEYEADDLIGALSVHTEKPVRIVSSDKDLAQLVNDRVTMLVPGFSGGLEARDKAGVEKKFDVRPDQIIDYLSLIGDAADNIAGLQGVGPKTAAKLLHDCDSIGEMLSDPGRIANEKLRAKVVENASLLRRNQKLIRLRDDLPERWKSPEKLVRKKPDWERIKDMIRSLDLFSLRRELESAEKGAFSLRTEKKEEKAEKKEPENIQGTFDF